MKHEAEEVGIADVHQRGGVHADGMAVLREKLAGDGLKDCEEAAQRKRNAGERDQRTAVREDYIEEATVVFHWH